MKKKTDNNHDTKTYLHVYGRIERGRGKTGLVKIGAMFPHEKGDGYGIVLDALPRNFHETGELVAFPARERSEGAEETGA